MFWKKKPINFEKQESVHTLASQLGVERRHNVRAIYPLRTTATLPSIEFKQKKMRVHDLSVGGCCLIDPEEILGSKVGNELLLNLQFRDGKEQVQSRIVGRIDDRRHIQFLNLSAARIEGLRKDMVYAVRGLGMKPGLKVSEPKPSLAARELWSSLHGDALIVEDGVHRLAQAEISGNLYYFFREAYPVDRNLRAVSQASLNHLILFLCNINYRSSSLNELLSLLESLALQETPGEHR